MPTGPGSENLSHRSGLEWLGNSVSMPADRRVLLAAAAVAIATDIAVRSGGVGLGGALLVAVVAGGLLVLGVLLASADVVFRLGVPDRRRSPIRAAARGRHRGRSVGDGRAASGGFGSFHGIPSGPAPPGLGRDRGRARA